MMDEDAPTKPEPARIAAEPAPSPDERDAAAPGGDRATVGITWWKKCLFALVFFAILWGLAEVALALCGVKPIPIGHDPYLRLSAGAKLFEEQMAADGTTRMVTAPNKIRFFNRQSFPMPKLAGTYRVFCVGGSTTFGRPYDDTTSFCGWLRTMLPVADPSHGWELINAGGISYASYRVAALAEELVEYEPDLFIVYSGHNEFLEERTYGWFIRAPAAVRFLGATLSRTRVYAAAKGLIDRSGGSQAAQPELSDRLDVVLDRTVGPESYHRDDTNRDAVLRHYEANLRRIVAIAKSRGADVILVTPASSPRDCAPFKSAHRADLPSGQVQVFNRLMRDGQDALHTGARVAALAVFDRALQIDDRYALAHYRRGEALWRLTRYEDAAAAFGRALDEDVCPLRALDPVYDIVMRVGRETGAVVYDFVELTERLAENGVPGNDLFLDHVHPRIEVNRQLALALIEFMSERGIVHPANTWDDAARERVKTEVESKIDVAAQGQALCNLAQVLNWAGKTGEAYELALRATRMAPGDMMVHFRAGRIAARLERYTDAAAHYTAALRVEPDSFKARYSLGEAYAATGKIEDAVDEFRRATRSRPESIEAWSALARYQAMLGRGDEAIASLERVLNLQPNHVDAHRRLADLLLAQNQFREAIAHYEKVTAQHPGNVDVQADLQAARRKLAEEHSRD